MYDFYVPTRDDAPGVLDSQDTDPVHVAVEDLRRRTMWRSKRMITLAEGNVEFNEQGKPRTPYACHNGLPGRGHLGMWGPNHSVYAVVTREREGTYEVLVVPDGERDEYILPGGLLEDAAHPRIDCLGDLLSTHDSTILYAGPLADVRNTRHAWVEACVLHVHLDDDAQYEGKGTTWVAAHPDLLNMHAAYKTFIHAAVAPLQHSDWIQGVVLLWAILGTVVVAVSSMRS